MFRIIFLLSLILLSCNKTDVVSKDFVLAYAELRVAEQEHGEAEDGKITRSQILKKHGLSAETFDEKIENIKKDTENWIVFQRAVVDILDSMNKAAEPKPEPNPESNPEQNQEPKQKQKQKQKIEQNQELKPKPKLKLKPEPKREQK